MRLFTLVIQRGTIHFRFGRSRVAFKVASALLEEPPAEFLDLVAIGTIADLVSLTDENRILVSLGIDAIHHSERIGLQALFEESGVK